MTSREMAEWGADLIGTPLACRLQVLRRFAVGERVATFAAAAKVGTVPAIDVIASIRARMTQHY